MSAARILMVVMLGSLVAAGASAETPKARIDGVENKALAALIDQAVGQARSPAVTRFEARRRAIDAAATVVSVLRSEGYYGSEVTPDVSDDEKPMPLVRVVTGKRFTLDDPQILWTGTPPVPGVQAAGEQIMGLTIGGPGRAADVVGAEGRIAAAVEKRGYPDVAPDDRRVVVDHAVGTVQPTFRIAAGDRAVLGAVILQQAGRTDPAFVSSLARWKPDQIYDPALLGRLERRLRETGVYDQVSVTLAPKDKVAKDGSRPVWVTLADRRPRTIDASAGWSSSEGASIDARWLRYNRSGRAETLTLLGRLAEIGQKLDAEMSRPHWRRPDQSLKYGGAAYANQTDAFDDVGLGVRADITRRYKETSYVTLGASFDVAQTTQKVQVNKTTVRGQDQTVATTTVLGAFALDRSNDLLNPVRGWRVEARAEPTLLTGDVSLPYLKLQAQGTVYLPLDPKAATVVAGRLKLGTIVGGTVTEVAANRRFYAGGGGSVRGYAYQGIGPRLSDNTPQGGRSLLETSVELRRKIKGAFSAVAFVDGGAVGSQEFPDKTDFRAGVGVGVRYDLGFGPLRADIAVPLGRRSGDPAFQLYLSIGQSF